MRTIKSLERLAAEIADETTDDAAAACRIAELLRPCVNDSPVRHYSPVARWVVELAAARLVQCFRDQVKAAAAERVRAARYKLGLADTGPDVTIEYGGEDVPGELLADHSTTKDLPPGWAFGMLLAGRSAGRVVACEKVGENRYRVPTPAGGS